MTPKYLDFIKRSRTSTYVVAEGAWRSGKTVGILLSHILYLDNLKVGGLHIVGAESISTARVILMNNPNGLSYTTFFGERCQQKQYEGKDALYIKNKHGKTQILLFVATAKANSWTSIRGLTAMSVFVTEVNLAHSSFIDEAIGRTISTPAKYRKLIFDLNPKSSNDWFYKRYLDEWQVLAEQEKLTLAYEHFVYEDNPGLSQKEKQEILQQYDPDSVVYKAFILGMRIAQADNIFNLREYNKISKPPKPKEYVITVDPGVSVSSTVFLSFGIGPDNNFYAYNVYHHKNGREIGGDDIKDYADYAEDLVEFIREQEIAFESPPRHVLIDNDIAFYRITSNVFRKNQVPVSWLKYAVKDKIEDRIRVLSSLLYQGILKIWTENALLIEAIENAVYDSKELEQNGKLVREDKPKSKKDELNFADFLDALDYAVSWAIRRNKLFGLTEVNN